jgi:hypothetical protein
MTKEERKEYNERYRKENAYRLQLYRAEYHKTHKEQEKAYRQKHREKYVAYNKKYYRENKDLWEDFYRPRQIIKESKKVLTR